ncbi:MAG: hypothetical protein COB04_00365 [Gammaproteobacteria bacterium]|nr:MAG: hypothetical protein COB04_00365 [Gammaproteobacteria bacterium]
MFMRFGSFRVVRTSKNLNSLMAVIAAASALAIVGARLDVTAQGNWIPVTYALVVGLAGFLVYVYWYSRFDRSNNQVIEIGRSLPAFSLMDYEGNEYHDKDFKGKTTLFMFYRGNWCPLCVAQVKELVAEYKELIALGVDVVLVSPQSQRNTRQLAKKFDVAFKFMVDEDNKVAEILDILNTSGTPAGLGLLGYESDTVLPTVFIIDQQGKIVYADLTDNYRVRPETEDFLKVLRGLAETEAA